MDKKCDFSRCFKSPEFLGHIVVLKPGNDVATVELFPSSLASISSVTPEQLPSRKQTHFVSAFMA